MKNSVNNWIIYLESVGIKCFLQAKRQLVVSSSLPNYPDSSNSFWITFINKKIYISTWTSNMYEIIDKNQLSEIIIECISSSKTAIYRINDAIIKKYNLRTLSENEVDTVSNYILDINTEK